MDGWITLLVGIALSSSLFALGILLWPRLQRKQGYSLEAEIEAALMPILFEAICAAYRTSEKAIDEGYERLRGEGKKQIADSVYAMLPDRIGDYDLTLIKQLIPPERFEQLVQDAFSRFDRFYLEHSEHFDEMFEEWKEANRPMSSAVSCLPQAGA
ncbi:MAG: hypothetical protein U9Q78_05155 [Chloroflexota bacterium]|nr:hypothetical protein [Chloroflexota bacterium]